jgi:hypothetical protein
MLWDYGALIASFVVVAWYQSAMLLDNGVVLSS